MHAERSLRFAAAMATLPLVAILRGITPAEAGEAARVLLQAGFRLIEVPLNSPEPFESIRILRRALPREAIVGAGTVLALPDAERLAALEADLIVMPHADPEIIGAARSLGLLCMPGVATPTEAFASLKAGADALKLFPAEIVTPAALRAMRAVLPPATRLLPVGGITPGSMKPYREAGAAGFGLGSSLYRAGMPVEELDRRANAFVAAWKGLAAPSKARRTEPCEPVAED
jgi:2-dehydro-3-deoxyphosphogalactonate aldolase